LIIIKNIYRETNKFVGRTDKNDVIVCRECCFYRFCDWHAICKLLAVYLKNKIYSVTKKRKLFLSVLFLAFPLMLLAQEHGNMKSGKTFFDFIFSAKYIVVYLFAAASLFFLWTKNFSDKARIILVSSAFILFGVIPLFADYLFITPSPVCAATKPFLYGFKPQFLATLSAVGVLSLVSVKGFCSTACPVGGLQELLYKIPFYKKFRVKFSVTNSVRIGLFVLFLAVAVTMKTSSYFYYNLFDLIHWDFNMPALEFAEFMLFLVIILLASVVLFKPFCYFICPMGLFTWVLEHFSIMKVRVDKSKCNGCGVCESKSPCASVNSILNEKTIRGDCHLCGKCITSCSHDALYFGFRRK